VVEVDLEVPMEVPKQKLEVLAFNIALVQAPQLLHASNLTLQPPNNSFQRLLANVSKKITVIIRTVPYSHIQFLKIPF
jgi:hypothetical protein